MKKTFEIILIIVGLILGSMARISTHLTPAHIDVKTNQDVKVIIKDNDKQVNEIEFEGISMIPIHMTGGGFLFSPTLSMDDLISDARVNENRITKYYNISTDKDVDNCYLYAELELSGEDELNNAVRVTIQQGKNIYTVKQGEPILMDAFKLSTKDRYLCFDFYYELEDPSCTIENINNATGTDVTLKLYGYVTE